MNDPMLKISVCDRRTNTRYKNLERNWSWIKERNRRPVRTSETVAEYPTLPKEKRDELKDQGGFVGGWLQGGIRKKGHVLSRCVGCLDADNIPAETDFPALCRKTFAGLDWFLYSTHKHRPEAPRFRLVMFFDREVSEEEYPALMRMVAKNLGMDLFDDSTYEPHRMMYWASCSSDSQFVFDESLGCPLPVDRYLAKYKDWRDVSQWPVSSRQSELMNRSVSEQQDPLNKDGLVGAFCRTFFPIQSAMEAFLSDVYAPTAVDGCWDYIPADSTAGVVVYNDRFVYLYERRNYLADRKDPTLAKGTVRRESVCNAEIWAECFGRNLADMKPTDSYAIAALMIQLEGWERAENRLTVPLYGQQRVYRRRRTVDKPSGSETANKETFDFLD